MNKIRGDKPDVSRRTFLSSTAVVGAGLMVAEAVTSTVHAASSAQVADLPRVTQEMVAPPFLPKHDQLAEGGPKVVEVRFVIEEKKMILDALKMAEHKKAIAEPTTYYHVRKTYKELKERLKESIE